MEKKQIVVGLFFAVIVYHLIAYSTISIKYRMIVEVDTPNGVKTGSTVVKMKTQRWPEWLSGLSAGNISDTSMKGEAVFVDLGDGKNIVVTLHQASGRITLVPPAVFSDPKYAVLDKPRFFSGYLAREDELEAIKNLSKSEMIGLKAEVPAEWMPTIITFNDVTDPDSMELIVYDEYADYFSTKFGEGYQLKGVWLEVSDNPVTKGLENHLPFLNDPNLGAIILDTPPPFNNKVYLYDDYYFRTDYIYL